MSKILIAALNAQAHKFVVTDIIITYLRGVDSTNGFKREVIDGVYYTTPEGEYFPPELMSFCPMSQYPQYRYIYAPNIPDSFRYVLVRDKAFAAEGN